MKIDQLQTPCYVIDEGKLEENLKILHQVENYRVQRFFWLRKLFLFFGISLIGKYISRTTASGSV